MVVGFLVFTFKFFYFMIIQIKINRLKISTRSKSSKNFKLIYYYLANSIFSQKTQLLNQRFTTIHII